MRRFAQKVGYSLEDVREARQVMRDANVPEAKIVSVLHLLAHAAVLDGVGSTLTALALRPAQQAERDER